MAEHALNIQGEPEDHSHSHPSESVYVRVAAVLAVITTVEVVIWYIDWFHRTGALIPSLVILSIIKFGAVIGYFMHLKFDDHMYRNIFLFGLILSIVIVSALMVLLRTHQIEYGLRLITGS